LYLLVLTHNTPKGPSLQREPGRSETRSSTKRTMFLQKGAQHVTQVSLRTTVGRARFVRPITHMPVRREEKQYPILKNDQRGMAPNGPSGPPGRHANSGKIITVFGATGFLGRYVVDALGRSGSTLIVPTRDDDISWRHLKVRGVLLVVLGALISTHSLACVSGLRHGVDVLTAPVVVFSFHSCIVSAILSFST
jgi:hypothetical protein